MVIGMKDLEKYKDEIHRCSKCGLCQSVCPVYQQTGNDCSVSRGKFIMLNGVIKGDLKLNKNVNKYLDMCLKCNACKNFCPSGIDARKIFLAAKSEYFQTCSSSKMIKSFQSKFVFNTVLKLAKFASNTYRALRFDKLLKRFYPLFLKFGELGKKVILANEFVKEGSKARGQEGRQVLQPSSSHLKDPSPQPSPARGEGVPANHPALLPSSPVIAYFKGCVNEYINPSSKNAAEYVLKQMGVNVLPINFECCGVPFLSCGNVEQFKKQAEYNLSKIPDEVDYFLTDCASCQNAFFEYENYIEDEELLAKLKKINEKSINVVDFILNKVDKIEFKEKTTFTFHKPCHLEDVGFLKEFVSKTKNIEYVEMQEYDKCCGFSGEFAIKNIQLSQKISKKKVQNAMLTKADYVLTTCPACLLGLSQGFIENGCFDKPALNFVEFIALADSISFNN